MAILKRIILIVTAISIFLVLTGCIFKESEPQDPVQKFFNAVKYGDTKGAFECFHPSFQQELEGALALGSLFGVNTDALSTVLGGYIGEINREYYDDYTFVISDVTYSDDEHATVEVAVYINENLDETTEISTMKYDGEWYIEPW